MATRKLNLTQLNPVNSSAGRFSPSSPGLKLCVSPVNTRPLQVRGPQPAFWPTLLSKPQQPAAGGGGRGTVTALCPGTPPCSRPGKPARTVPPGDICVRGWLQLGGGEASRPILGLRGDIWPPLLASGTIPHQPPSWGSTHACGRVRRTRCPAPLLRGNPSAAEWCGPSPVPSAASAGPQEPEESQPHLRARGWWELSRPSPSSPQCGHTCGFSFSTSFRGELPLPMPRALQTSGRVM